jgi:hypothetical protein
MAASCKKNSFHCMWLIVDFSAHNLIVSGSRRRLDTTRRGTTVLVARIPSILLVIAFQLPSNCLILLAWQQNRTKLVLCLSLSYTKSPQLALPWKNKQPFQYSNTHSQFCCSFPSTQASLTLNCVCFSDSTTKFI